MVVTRGCGLLEFACQRPVITSHLSTPSLTRCWRQEWGTPALSRRIANRRLPLGLAASQLLHLRLLRPARIIAGLQRLFRLTFLARSAPGFLTFFSAEFCRVCHVLFLEKFCNLVIAQFCNLKAVLLTENYKTTRLQNYQIDFRPALTGHTFPPASSSRSVEIVP